MRGGIVFWKRKGRKRDSAGDALVPSRYNGQGNCWEHLCKHTFKYDLTESQVLIFLTLFSLKCGSSDFRALRKEVR